MINEPQNSNTKEAIASNNMLPADGGINYENLLKNGFEPCVFAPIYIARYCFYLGDVDWTTKDFSKCTMMLAQLATGDWVDDFEASAHWTKKTQMKTIQDVIDYCTKNNIKMQGSKSPYRNEK